MQYFDRTHKIEPKLFFVRGLNTTVFPQSQFFIIDGESQIDWHSFCMNHDRGRACQAFSDLSQVFHFGFKAFPIHPESSCVKSVHFEAMCSAHLDKGLKIFEYTLEKRAIVSIKLDALVSQAPIFRIFMTSPLNNLGQLSPCYHFFEPREWWFGICFRTIEQSIYVSRKTEDLSSFFLGMKYFDFQDIKALRDFSQDCCFDQISKIEQKGQDRAQAIPLKKSYMVLCALQIITICGAMAICIAAMHNLTIDAVILVISTTAFIALKLWTTKAISRLISPVELRRHEIDIATDECNKISEIAAAIGNAICQAENQNLKAEIKKLLIRNARLKLNRGGSL